jgi:hypothetical protein
LERRFFDQFNRARRKLDPGPLSALTRLGWQAEERRDDGYDHNRMLQTLNHRRSPARHDVYLSERQ